MEGEIHGSALWYEHIIRFVPCSLASLWSFLLAWYLTCTLTSLTKQPRALGRPMGSRHLQILFIAILALIVFGSSSAFAQSEEAFTLRRWTKGKSFIKQGTLEVAHVDNFTEGRHFNIYLLKEKRGARHQLVFEAIPEDIKHGDKVKVQGRKARNGLLYIAPSRGDSITTIAQTPTRSKATTGARTMLILRITSSDGAVSCSASSLAGTAWDGSSTIDGAFRAYSFDQLSFIRDANNDGQAEVADVSIAATTAGKCEWSNWAALANSAAQARGITLSQYDHIGYVLPNNSSCGWAGLAYVGGTSYWVHGNYCGTSYKDVFIHEVGHNLGLGHASYNGSEYDDRSCPMGYGGVGDRHFSSARKVQLGWLPGSTVVQPAAGRQTFMLEALELPSTTAAYMKVLTIPTGVGLEKYYVSYRRRVGSYSGNLGTTYDGKVSIHKFTSGSAATSLVAILGEGQNFTDSSLGFTLTVLARNDATSTATVESNFACTAVSPSITLAPELQGTNRPGTALSYNVTVTNNDSDACGAAIFSLESYLLPGWTSNFESTTLNLAAGQSGSTAVTIIPPSSLEPGSYAFSLQAGEPNHGTVQKEGFYLLDTIAPTAPAGLTAELVKGKGKRLNVVLKWQASADTQSAVPGYTVYRNGIRLGTTPGTGFTDANPIAGTGTYVVTASDAAGNESAPSNSAIVTNSSSSGSGGSRGGSK